MKYLPKGTLLDANILSRLDFCNFNIAKNYNCFYQLNMF